MISMIAVSSIESPPIRELGVTIKRHQTYMNLTCAPQKTFVISVVKRAHARGTPRPNSDVLAREHDRVRPPVETRHNALLGWDYSGQAQAMTPRHGLTESLKSRKFLSP
jgi:hypothetical protein